MISPKTICSSNEQVVSSPKVIKNCDPILQNKINIKVFIVLIYFYNLKHTNYHHNEPLK